MQTALEWALETAQACVALLNDAGNVVDANTSLGQVFGYSRSSLIGQPLELLIADRSRAAARDSCSRCLSDAGPSSDQPMNAEVLARRKDGHEFPALLQLKRVTQDGKDMVFASLVGTLERKSPFQHFSLALEAAPTGMILVDQDGRIVLVNAETERLFGYARGKLEGEPLELLIPERLRSRHEVLRQQFAEAPQTRAMGAGRDLYGVRQDGREVPVEIGLNALAVDGKRYVLCSVIDITERKRAFDHFRLALEAAPTGMLLVNEAGTIVLLNAQVERIFGYARDELVGRSLEQLVPERLRGDHEAFRGAFFADARTRPMGAGRDLYGLHKSGHEVPVEIALTPLDQREGRLVLTSIVDITERKLLESSLRENEARYRQLFNDSPVALLEEDFSEVKTFLETLQAAGIHDIDAYLRARPDVLVEAIGKVKVIMVNQRALQLFEASAMSELDGLNAFFTPRTHAWFRAGVTHLLLGQRHFGQETITRTIKDGTRTVSKRLHLLPGHDATWSRAVVSLFDLTPHKLAEEKLRTSLHEKEVLLREVHHRVKNNLQIISSLLNMTADTVQDMGMQQVFADCQTRVQSLAFVHEHLYVSADLSHVPFAQYARTLVDHLKVSCRKPGLNVTSRLDMEDVSLSIEDAIPCGLILNELVTNALKHAFGASGAGSIDIGMRKLDAQQVELSVRDDGQGLPPELDPRSSGSLGLDLVFTFAEQLRAEVEVSRSSGTAFTFRFTPGLASFHGAS
jgi:PAS domain S-box-containing protein